MKEILDDVSDIVFPGSKRLKIWRRDDDIVGPILIYDKKQQEIVSSLELQVSLYFHWRFSILWVVTHSILLYKKSNNITQFERLVTSVTFVIWCIIEIFRIYLGYCGNLREQVPHLAGFFFLSLFPQFILMIIFLILPNYSNQTSLEIVFLSFQIAFFIFELIFGYLTTKNVIRVKTLRFKMERQLKKKTKQIINQLNQNQNQNDLQLKKNNHNNNLQTNTKTMSHFTTSKDFKVDPADIIK